MAQLYIAKGGLATMHKGQRVHVQRGQVAEEGHWILEVAPAAFKPLVVAFPAPAPKPKPAKQQ